MSTDFDAFTDIAALTGNEKLIAAISGSGFNLTTAAISWRGEDGWTRIGNNFKAFKGSNFGLSPAYGALIIGDTGPNNIVCFGYDPIANLSDQFDGTGRGLYFRKDVTFNTPNAANTGFHKSVLSFNEGKVGVGTSSPTAPLHIIAPSQYGNTATDGLRITGSFVGGDVLKPTGFGAINWCDPVYGTYARINAIITTPSASTATALAIETNGFERIRIQEDANIRPGANGTQSLGTASYRWSSVYAASGAINTSDATQKTEPEPIPNEWLNAWGDVEWQRYKFKDGNRWHIGLIAQRVHAAFAAHEIDAFEIGLCCFDEWEEERAPVYEKVIKKRMVTREVTSETIILDKPLMEEVEEEYEEQVDTGETRIVREKGEAWGLRYDECFAIEAAWQRREMERLTKRLDAIEALEDGDDSD